MYQSFEVVFYVRTLSRTRFPYRCFHLDIPALDCSDLNLVHDYAKRHACELLHCKSTDLELKTLRVI